MSITNPYTEDMSEKPNIDDIIRNLPDDALPPDAAIALGRTPVQGPVQAAQAAPVQAVQEAAPAVPTGGGKKTFKRKGGRKHRRKTHKKNKRRSSKRRQ